MNVRGATALQRTPAWPQTTARTRYIADGPPRCARRARLTGDRDAQQPHPQCACSR